ncbi:MAG TPA: hypothetical protein VGI12_07095 [Vicinamibacterales bacterium]|jgi:hypothetical protein
MTRPPLLAIVALAGTCTLPAVAAPQSSEVGRLLEHIGDRVTRYYHRAQSLVCTETSTMQPVNRDWSWEGLSRTVESELRVEAEASDGQPLPEARLIRDIRRVNGREPRDRDRTDRSGCTDPDPFSAEPLAFLLRSHSEEYRFTAVHETRERNRAALVLDFESADRTNKADLIEDPRGHDDCFDWRGPIAVRGRVWVDALSYEVLRVDRYNAGPVDLRVPSPLQRKHGLSPYVTLDREDRSMRFKEIAFRDPDEIILLPESIESLVVVRNGLQSMRSTTTFRDYHRFLTVSRVTAKRDGGS